MTSSPWLPSGHTNGGLGALLRPSYGAPATRSLWSRHEKAGLVGDNLAQKCPQRLHHLQKYCRRVAMGLDNMSFEERRRMGGHIVQTEFDTARMRK